MPQNLRELLELRAAAAPDKPFLLSESDGRDFTYREFDAAVNRTARFLSASGIGKGDRVSLLLPNSAEYVIAYFACFKLGALAGPVNSLLKPEEIAFVVNDSGARLLLVSTEFQPRTEGLRGRAAGLEQIVLFDDWDAATRAHRDAPGAGWRDTPLAREDEAIIIYTSGTTGKPKGCLLTHGNLLANARQITE